MLASSSARAPTTPDIHLSLTCLVWFREKENTTLISVGTFPSGTPVVHLSPKPKCPIAQTVSMTKECISANSDQSHWKNKCTVHHPKTNMDPLIMMVSNRNLPWKVTFRCHVSFPGCTICQINYFFQKSALMKVSNYEFLQCQCCVLNMGKSAGQKQSQGQLSFFPFSSHRKWHPISSWKEFYLSKKMVAVAGLDNCREIFGIWYSCTNSHEQT